MARDSLLEKPGRKIVKAGLDRLPDRLLWGLMSAVRLNIPDPQQEDFQTTGRAHRDQILNWVSWYESNWEIEGKNILEVGCGPGRILVPMAEQGAKAYGTDISRLNLRRCKAYAEQQGVEVLTELSEEHIPFSTEFDLIYSYELFLHVKRRVMLSYLKSAYEHLSSNGIVCFCYRNVEHEKSLSSLLSELDKRYSFRVRYHSSTELESYMDAIGYSDINIFDNKSSDPPYDVQLVALAKK